MTQTTIEQVDKNNEPDTKVTLDLLKSISSMDIDAGNLEDMLKNMSCLITEYLDSDYCAIILKDAQDEPTRIFTADENSFDPNQPAPQALISNVINSGSAMTISATAPATTTSMCVPLIAGDSITGLIFAQADADCKWDHNTLKTVELIGRYLGLTVSNIDLRQQCRQNERLVIAGRATLDLSHSVKNILQMVGGAAEVIDLGLKINQLDRVERSWAILKPNLDRLRKFMLDMLAFSKERPLELGPCDFNRIIQDAIESLKSQLKQKLSQLNMQIDQKIPTIELDSERILEMALNIILNAIDIVDEEDGIVCVETRYLKDTQMIELRVTDNGPGIDDEMKAKLFTPFESGKNKFGTGLGMPIAKRIIDTHKGNIEVTSEMGQGTTIIIQLPAKIIES